MTDDISGEPKKWSLWIGNSASEASVLYTCEVKTAVEVMSVKSKTFKLLDYCIQHSFSGKDD